VSGPEPAANQGRSIVRGYTTRIDHVCRTGKGRVGRSVLIASLVAGLALSAAAEQQRANITSTPSQSPAAAPTSTRSSQRVIDLSVEPVIASSRPAPATLREAAEANDYTAFESLYQRALRNREPLGAFADLHDIWTLAQTDATGSFFGADVFAKVVSRYPEFTAYIRDHRITDRNGQPLYPSRETRTFLLSQAINDVDPIVPIARHRETAAQPAARSAASARAPNRSAGNVAQVERAATRPVVAMAAAGKTSVSSAPAPVVRAPVAQSRQASTRIDAAPARDALAADVGNAVAAPREKPMVTENVMISDHARGIFFIILGLVGIGVLTMTMRTSSTDVHVVDDPPEESSIAATHDTPRAESHS
jgi:hypothetical protein